VSETIPVEVRGLTRRFGSREVIRDFDLTIRAGERVALRGPNGSGKTTIIRCLAGTMTPTEGDLRVLGLPAGSLEARRLVGVSLSQERSFYYRISGRENLLFFARLRGNEKPEAARLVDAVADELELSFVDQRVDQYSTGMSQQLAAARALLGDPPVLLLDEPTRSLDSDAVARFWAALDRRPASAVLIATHRDDDSARCGSSRELHAPETDRR
jgi:ABC-type multidrug transport system ATPase subunit